MIPPPPSNRYTKTHEWIRLEGDEAFVGMTDHAQKEMTDIVYAELPLIGKRLKAGEVAMVIESVKAAFDIYAPVGGEVIRINSRLEKDPGLVNRSPYDEGWLFVLKVHDPKEMENLLTDEAYLAMLGSDPSKRSH